MKPGTLILGLLILTATGVASAQDPPVDPGEFGDAPEGAIAYPSLGVGGLFPTCKGGPAGFVFHANLAPLAWFGPTMDIEMDGNAGICPPPPYEMDECWGPADGDGGLVNVTTYSIVNNQVTVCGLQVPDPLGDACAMVQWGPAMDTRVTNFSGNDALINVLIDWNQDGRWGGQSLCPNGGQALEHVVVNLPVPDGYAGMLSGLNPGPIQIGPNSGYVWMRLTIGDPFPMNLDWDGSYFFDTGETEDYLIEISEPGSGLGAGEMGDAPEDVVAYPTGLIGRFPTCIATGPGSSFIFHRAPITSHFGDSVDLESEGNHDLCSFLDYENDECHKGDGDGGLLRPASYTLKGSSPYVCSIGPKASLGNPCSIGAWGTDLDIEIDNSGGPDMYFNVLADWSGDGMWAGNNVCAGGLLGREHFLVDVRVPAGFNGPASLLTPPTFDIVSDGGYHWFRFSLTDVPVGQNWTGEGVFGDGETEDYLLWVAQPTGAPEIPERGAGLELLPNAPNPFNPSTEIRFSLTRSGPVTVTIHDLAGRLVRTLEQGIRESGEHRVVWHGDDDGGRRQPSGVFFVRVVSGDDVRSRKIMMLK
ncbi:T9SS type A sorting domain-containing protein [bacterium]|nr:T9SS type A sorting domain-containing protein [bacterium]